jgi:hypothetical protein
MHKMHAGKIKCINDKCLYSSLAIKNTDDNGPTKKDPASSDLLCDGEQ